MPDQGYCDVHSCPQQERKGLMQARLDSWVVRLEQAEYARGPHSTTHGSAGLNPLKPCDIDFWADLASVSSLAQSSIEMIE